MTKDLVPEFASREEIEIFQKYGILPKESTIYLTDGEEGEIDWVVAENFMKNLMILDRFDHDILVIVNSCGGCVYNGLAIYDTIKNCRNHVIAEIRGQAMSMASVFVQAADERHMQKNASMMIHYGSMTAEGDAKKIYNEVKENQRLDKLVEEIYLNRIKRKKSRFSRKKLDKLMSIDTYLCPKEALKYGLIDKII